METLIVRDVGFVRSQGLVKSGQDELLLPYVEPQNAVAAAEMCELLMKYVEESGRNIKEGDKVPWATSVVSFQREGKYLVACGLDIRRDVFERGVDEILTTWRMQRQICDDNKSDYMATNLEQMIVITPDLLTGGGVVEGIRYPFNPPNCGWWLFGEDFSGEIESMRRVHVGHVAEMHGNTVKFLALKPGFAFRPGTDESVWFEEAVAASEAV